MPAKTDYWKKVLRSAQEELEAKRASRDRLQREVSALDAEVVQLEQLVQSLQSLTTEEPQDDAIRVEGVADLELADAIREVLNQSASYRTPRGIRDSLKISGYDLDQHPNPLASIHGVVKRLVASGEAIATKVKGADYYRLRSEPSGIKTKDEIDKLRVRVRTRS